MEANNYDGPLEAALSSDLRGPPHNFALWDIHTGTQLVVFKGSKNNPMPKCLQFIDNDYFITATDNLLHVWSIFNRKCQTQRLFLPNRPSTLCISPCGNYMIVGISEMIYVWQIYSGNLLAHTQRHYQIVSTLKMNRDGTFLFSAGEDGMVLVWSFADLISATHNTGALNPQNCSSETRGVNEPIHTWQHHSAQVTDMFITNSGLCMTVSTDKTMNLYSYLTGKRLACIVLPSPLWSVTMNKNETRAFVGGHTGDIYEIVVSSLSLSQMNQQRSSENGEGAPKRPIFVGHTDKVVDLFISIDGSRLVSASKDSTCKIWDIYERKLLHNIKHQAPLANLKSILIPEAFALSSMTQSKVKPPLNVKPFKRNVYKMPRDSTLLSTELFDEGSTTIISIKNSANVMDAAVHSFKSISNSIAESQSPSTESVDLPSTARSMNNSPGNLSDEHADHAKSGAKLLNLKQKFRDLYLLSAEHIFKDAAQESLQPYKGLAEEIIKIAPRCDKKARRHQVQVKRQLNDVTLSNGKSSKRQKGVE